MEIILTDCLCHVLQTERASEHYGSFYCAQSKAANERVKANCRSVAEVQQKVARLCWDAFVIIFMGREMSETQTEVGPGRARRPAVCTRETRLHASRSRPGRREGSQAPPLAPAVPITSCSGSGVRPAPPPCLACASACDLINTILPFLI